MKRKYSKIIKQIAEQEGVSPEYVYAEMQRAIEEGYNNPDPKVQEQWDEISPYGDIPTPEEVIKVLSQQVKKK